MLATHPDHQTLISGRQQAYRVRGAYLESILKQDMAWHDTGEASSLQLMIL